MKKSEFINEVAEKVGITKKDARIIINSVFNTIREALLKDDVVNIVPFGKFEVKNRASRMVRNPQTGKTLKIPEKRVVKFKSSKGLKEILNY